MNDKRNVNDILTEWDGDPLDDSSVNEDSATPRALQTAHTILRSLDDHVDNARFAIQEFVRGNPIASKESRLADLVKASEKIVAQGKRLHTQAVKAQTEFSKKK